MRCAKAFIAHYRCPPERLGAAHVRQWLLYLLQEKQRKPATVNVAIGALSFLFGTTLNRPEVMRGIRSVRKELPAPTARYTHMSESRRQRLRRPLDLLGTKEGRVLG